MTLFAQIVELPLIFYSEEFDGLKIKEGMYSFGFVRNMNYLRRTRRKRTIQSRKKPFVIKKRHVHFKIKPNLNPIQKQIIFKKDSIILDSTLFDSIGFYVITIRPARYEAFQNRIQDVIPIHLVKKIDGVNGTLLDFNELLQKKQIMPNAVHRLRRGQIGCYLSHLKVWKEMKDIDVQFAFIMEDDIAMNASMRLRFQNILNVLKSNQSKWDICYISYNILRGTTNKGFHPSLKRINKTGWTTRFGYILNQKAATILYQASLPIKNIPGDVLIGQIANQFKLKSFILDPPLSGEIDNSDSDTTKIK